MTYAKVYKTKVLAPEYGPLYPSETWTAIVESDPGKSVNAETLAEIKTKLNIKVGGLAKDENGKTYRKGYKA